MTPTLIQYGQLAALQLQTADGAKAVIALYGAHLLSWQSADGCERLFLSSLSSLDGSRAIRGGVPLIFPQFGTQGTGQRHGFARIATWHVEECGSTDEGSSFAELVLTPQDLVPELAKQWPCRLRYRVSLSAQGLDLQLQVDNLGHDTLEFAAALHTYFALDDIRQLSVQGLQDVHYVENATTPPQSGTQDQMSLCCTEKVDRQYRNLRMPLQIKDGDKLIHWQQSGFCDAVVWNPWQADAKALDDMADEEYRRFICVEAAHLTPLSLEPGKSWIGQHTLSASGR